MTQSDSRPGAPQRPRINITVPPVYMAPQLQSAQYSPAHYFQHYHQQHQNPLYQPPPPASPSRISVVIDGTNQPPDYTDYYSMYPAKAGEFVFKQFEGFRDFTMNTAKSGLGVGEKSVFWLYTKITKWSRNWFTHIFLFLMLFLYSVAGAALFIAVEGTHEKKMETNVNHAKNILAKNLRILALDREKLENPDPDLWEGRAINLVEEYSAVLYEAYKEGSFENKHNKKTWTFWNSVFYCGTIYTTIDDSSDGGKISDTEVRKRRERIERYQSERSKDGDQKSSLLQNNLTRFNEERRKFELEKLKFLQEKRELDRMRLRRFEKYREELLEEQRQKLQIELRNRERDERSKSIEAPILPPAPPTRSKTPVSPGAARKKILIIPKTSSPSASSSEEEGHNTSDEEHTATIRRRFSPRKPKRPRSAKIDHLKLSKTPEPATSPEPESELPSDFPPEPEPTEPEAIVTAEIGASSVVEPEPSAGLDQKAEEEMVLTQRKITKTDDGGVDKDELQEKEIGKDKDEDKKKVEAVVDDKLVVGPKEKKRRRALLVYQEKKDDLFTWSEILGEMKDFWLDFLDDNPLEIRRMRLQINECVFYFGVMVMLCGVGGIIFRVTEGTFESQYKCGVKRVKRDFIDQLWISSHSQREEDWKQTARARLRKFEEELQVAFEAGMKTYSGNTAWNFINGVIYSLTVVSTIGYGHISPSTTTGRALTIVYAIIGIPIFLIVLADFGKLFTRGIKFLWAYVRRLYYTGSIRKVRKTAQVKEVMKGLNVMYDMVRRPSGDHELQPTNIQGTDQPQPQPSTSAEVPPTCESPATPVPETFEIDDEFNLPISIAIFILVAYMLFGATIYYTWENWSFFEAFYFVFISISTIGFGDFVPQHPIYMMCSILYLIFGLALTSMCINVVQLKLSDSFRQASAKIGATIGLQMAEAASLQQSQTQSHVQTPVELNTVHTSTPTSDNGSQQQPAPPTSLNGDATMTPVLPERPKKVSNSAIKDDKTQ